MNKVYRERDVERKDKLQQFGRFSPIKNTAPKLDRIVSGQNILLGS